METCRLCLAPDLPLSRLNDSISRQIRSLYSKFCSKARDLICTECLSRLRVSYEFQQMIIETDDQRSSNVKKDISKAQGLSGNLSLRRLQIYKAKHTIHCNNCNEEIHGLEAIEGHTRMCKRKVKDDDNEDTKIAEVTIAGIRRWKCLVCAKFFERKHNCVRHLLVHMPKNSIERRRFTCSICQKGFANKTQLHLHFTVHTKEKIYFCEHCGKCFARKTLLAQHLLRHSDVRPFACVYCPSRFVAKSDLARHILTHTGEKSHTCDLCGKTFGTKSSIRNHIRRHVGNLKYKCDICLRKFISPSDLAGHHRQHTGERPYPCDYCELRFSRKSEQTKHLRSHLGNLYECDVCYIKFRTRIEQRQHMVSHGPNPDDIVIVKTETFK